MPTPNDMDDGYRTIAQVILEVGPSEVEGMVNFRTRRLVHQTQEKDGVVDYVTRKGEEAMLLALVAGSGGSVVEEKKQEVPGEPNP